MVDIKVIENIIGKCSNREIRSRLSELSSDEKRNLLIDKTNPLEKQRYTYLVDEIEFWESLGDEHLSPDQKVMLDDLKKEVFNYEKRIIVGYNLNKNLKNLPSIDVDSFNEDAPLDVHDESIKGLEKNQITYQDKNLVLSELSVNSLQSYFGSDYKHINGDLDKNYGDGYWGRLSSEQRQEYHEKNKVIVPNIDKAINDSPGLLVDTVLYHGTNDSNIISINNRIGDTITFKGYVSTSFNMNIGKAYGGSVNGFLVKFLAPKGTKGICANTSKEYLTYENGEHEYLLGRGSSGVLMDVDYNSKPPVATVLVK